MTEAQSIPPAEPAEDTIAPPSAEATEPEQPPSPETAYEALVPDARILVDGFVEALRADRNWKVRRKTLLDRLEGLEMLWSLSRKEQDQLAKAFAADPNGAPDAPEQPVTAEEVLTALNPPTGAVAEDGIAPEDEDREGDEDHSDGNQERIAQLLTMFVTAILEQLNEERVTCPEQAAFYMLALNPVLVAKLDAWMEADRRNVKALRKTIRTDRRINALIKRMPPEFWMDPDQPPVVEGASALDHDDQTAEA